MRKRHDFYKNIANRQIEVIIESIRELSVNLVLAVLLIIAIEGQSLSVILLVTLTVAFLMWYTSYKIANYSKK